MDKTFALQVWHTAGMTRGIAPSTATSHLHSDNFTASPDFNTADDVLLTRHRLHDHGHPFSTASLTQPPRTSRSAECNEPMQQTIKARRPYRASAGTRPCNAPTGRATRTACPEKRQHMHHKTPAQTIKCVKFYTNASFLYVRSTL